MIIWNEKYLHYTLFGIKLFNKNLLCLMIKTKSGLSNYCDCKGIVGDCGLCDNSCENMR